MIFWRKKKKKSSIDGKSLKTGLEKTRKGIFGRLGDLMRGSNKLDDEFLEELEEILISSDVGVRTAMQIVEDLRERALDEKAFDPDAITELIKAEISGILETPQEEVPVAQPQSRPYVALIVGVNGTGKTTTIGKLANRFVTEGNRVVLAAADTFRAAAIEQLEIWAQRSGADIVKHKAQSDPAAVVFDAVTTAKNSDADVLLVDTAGRLHTKHNLMKELDKIKRVIQREIPDAPHDVFLVIDATTGQNGLTQAQEFLKVSGLSGIILTKLDGTAKGGVVIAITKELQLPIRFVGVGEQIDDLVDFDPDDFADGLFQE